MTPRKCFSRLFALALLITAIVSLCFNAAASEPVLEPSYEAPDVVVPPGEGWSKTSASLVVMLTPIIVWIVRGIVPKIPANWIPAVASLIGLILDVLLPWIGMKSTGLGFVWGITGVGLRELKVGLIGKTPKWVNWYQPSIAAALAFFIATGCEQLDRAYDKQVKATAPAPIATNFVLVTNIVLVTPTRTNDVTHDPEAYRAAVEEVATNSAATLQTRITPKYEVIYGAATFTTNLVAKPGVENAIQATNMIPVWGGLISTSLGLLYSGYRNMRNGQVKRALVESVERGREFLQEDPKGQELDAEFKKILARVQEKHGVHGEIAKLLLKHT